MFYDERINAEQGRAYRAAMIFSLIIITVYGILHGILLSQFGSFHVALMSVEIFCGIGGGLLVAYGELRYGIRPTDEMVDAQKRRYYSKAFMILLYMIIAVYCCIRAPFSIALGAYDVAANHLIVLLTLSAWLVLLFFFKKSDVPLNSSFIEVSAKDYWMRVMKNIGVLGGITAFFTVISSFITLCLTESMGYFLGVLLAGFITFLSFAAEYTIFSFAERSSDKARENGKISPATLIFAAVTAAAYLFCAAVSTYIIIDEQAVNSAAAVMRINAIQQYFDYIIFYFAGLLAIYLFSELKALKSRGMFKATALFITVHVGSFCLGQLSRVSSPFISELLNGDPVSINTYLFCLEALNTVVLCVYIISLTLFIRSMISLGLATKRTYWYPTAFIALKIVNLILATQHSLANINAFAESFGELLLFCILLVFLCERRRRVSDMLPTASDDTD